MQPGGTRENLVPGTPSYLVPVTIILTLQRGWMFKIRLMYRKEEYHQVPG